MNRMAFEVQLLHVNILVQTYEKVFACVGGIFSNMHLRSLKVRKRFSNLSYRSSCNIHALIKIENRELG